MQIITNINISENFLTMKSHRHLIFLAIPIILACNALTPKNNNAIDDSTPQSANNENNNTDNNDVYNFEIKNHLDGKNYGSAIEMDSNGSIYILEENYKDSAALDLLKINKDNNLEWRISFPSPNNYYPSSNSSIAIDSNGDIIVSGESTQEWGVPIEPFKLDKKQRLNFFIAKVRAESGEIIWNTFINDEFVSKITLDKDDNIYFSSSNNIVKLNNNGNLEWKKEFSSEFPSAYPFELIISDSGNIYAWSFFVWGVFVSSADNESKVVDYILFGFSQDGNLNWETVVHSTEFQQEEWIVMREAQIAIDGEENIYLSGRGNVETISPLVPFNGGYPSESYYQGTAEFITKLDKSGKILWQTFLDNSIFVNDISIATDRNLYLIGGSSENWGNPVNKYVGNGDGFIAQMDKNGTLLWNSFVGESSSDGLAVLFLEDDYHLYVVGGNNTTSPENSLGVFMGGSNNYLGYVTIGH